MTDPNITEAPKSCAKIRAARIWRAATPVSKLISFGSLTFAHRLYKIVTTRRGMEQITLHTPPATRDRTPKFRDDSMVQIDIPVARVAKVVPTAKQLLILRDVTCDNAWSRLRTPLDRSMAWRELGITLDRVKGNGRQSTRLMNPMQKYLMPNVQFWGTTEPTAVSTGVIASESVACGTTTLGMTLGIPGSFVGTESETSRKSRCEILNYTSSIWYASMGRSHYADDSNTVPLIALIGDNV